MPHEETSAAIAGILSNFAKQYTPLEDRSFSSKVIANGIKSSKITLPGPDTIAKKTIERELTALSSRIQFLEAKTTNPGNSLPITPNEPLTSAFPTDELSSPKAGAGAPPRQRSASWVNNLLAKGDGEQQSRQLTEEQLSSLRDHVDQQAGEIKSQREYINSINDRLREQHEATSQALGNIGDQTDSVEKLQREVAKNQQINATYQKVLREIGTIVTAVANGDLSKKVLISTVEKDPEIAKFKHTINKMVDQLQEFASQVTHLAKEVGTEGRLGGQAVLPGVDGIWAELTQNGMLEK